MSYDGIVLKSITEELKNSYINTKIEKIYQPTKDSIILTMKTNGEKKKLLLNVSSQSPRINFTEEEFENPKTPPNFCMLLRKHLEGFKIIDFNQYEMDRILKIDVLSRDDLAFEIKKSLIIEIMGKYSNIILVETQTNRIIDSIKRVNHNMSSIREILPGLTYNTDLISNRLNPLIENSFDRIELNNLTIKNGFIKTFMGLSPIVIRDICYRANLDEDRPLNSLSYEDIQSLKENFYEIMNCIRKNEFTPILVKDLDKIIDFSVIDLQMYREEQKVRFKDTSKLIDTFYLEKLKNQILSDKSSELIKKIKNLIDREINKLQKQLKEFEHSKDRDKYKIYADLISSNLYRIEPGVKSIEVENFYDEMKPITISMDNKISPQANANKYYKKFAKLKNANLKLKDEIEKTQNSINYLKSVLFSLELSESSDDIDEIREELYEMNYLKKHNSKNKKVKLKISQLTNKNGDTIYCGKNNKQNEYLTLKFAGQNDIWFHVQNAPGSHVILKNNSGDFSESSILQAAKLAATNSSLKSSNNIPVDYTLKKYVKRHPSKIPGLVTYTNFKTIVIKQN